MRLRYLLPALAVCALSFHSLASYAEVFTPPVSARVVTSISGEWKFIKSDVKEASAVDFSDAAWETVTVPHTWNNKDGQDGGNDFFKGACWYRKHVKIDKVDGATYLKFDGANRMTTAYVNGVEVGKHTGGFAAFAFDVSKAIKAGDNVISVKVDNSPNDDCLPLSGDFTFFGGMYRNVSLINVPATQHIAVDDNGGPGVHSFVTKVSAESAQIDLDVSTVIIPVAPAVLSATLVDAAGNVAATATSKDVKHITLTVAKPHLWAGIPDPYMYKLYVTVGSDTITLPIGIRTMEFVPEKGFLLNGKKYDLHGVCRHQDWKDMGWAITPKQMDADMALLKELGATCIRLAHYQHDQYFYDLCDKNGLVVWAELSMVNAITNTPAFKDNAKQQLTELIDQNMHHPGIAMWSMANEVIYKNKGPSPYPFVGELSELSHKLDPTRPTVQAIMDNPPPKEPVTDLDAHNTYMGWYYGKLDDLPGYIEKHAFFAMSEYGAGSNPSIHAESPKQMDHSEEFQCFWHETYWRAMRNQPHIWGTYIWAFADFASDGRTEGGFFGRNDKGLVTFDRTIKKDVFYFYKAQWSTDPFVFITSRRFETRGVAKIPAKVYTNAPEAELFVNGKSVGVQKNDMGICLWKEIDLKEGANEVEVKSTVNGKAISDKITWTYKPGAPKLTKADNMMQ